MRIAFIKDWHDDLEHIGGNFDGILAAVAQLSKDHQVKFITRSFNGIDESFELNGISYFPMKEANLGHLGFIDVIIAWGSLDRPWHAELRHFTQPKILCFAGGPTTHENLSVFDHVCVESEVYRKAFSQQDVSVSRAFGTNTALFRPEFRTPKIFRAIYPASFCFHKNIEVFARALGSTGLAVGNWNEESIVSKCLELGTPVMRRVSSATLCDLYNMSYCTVVPCGPQGGAQRVVLESMACGVPVVLAEDNDKCKEFVEESGFGILVPPVAEAIREAVDDIVSGHKKLDPQMGLDYVRFKWSEYRYANALENAARSLLEDRVV